MRPKPVNASLTVPAPTRKNPRSCAVDLILFEDCLDGCSDRGRD
jgi:hypothetical protein